MLSLLLLLLRASSLLDAAMTLCEYYERLGLAAPPQCSGAPRPLAVRDATPRRHAVLHAAPGFAYPLCRRYFHSCMSSSKCESGTVCTSGVDATPCCTFGSCPPPSTLGIACTRPSSVSWCHSDGDCSARGRSVAASQCCPTGCNYNICVATAAFAASPPRLLTPPDAAHVECPAPHAFNIRCNVARPTSWCATHADCPSLNAAAPRRCCSTGCGYTACALRYNNKWILA